MEAGACGKSIVIGRAVARQGRRAEEPKRAAPCRRRQPGHAVAGADLARSMSALPATSHGAPTPPTVNAWMQQLTRAAQEFTSRKPSWLSLA
jgi:hypothetical protein